MAILRGKTIWVVGASSGIGEALAQQLASEGNFVLASARSAERLNRLALSVGARIKVVPLDVRSQSSLDQAKISILEVTDFIDVLIYCAGTCEYENDLDFQVAMYERVMDVNFFGLVRTLNAAKTLLRKAEGRPQLVVVSSLSTVLPLPRNEAYGASKAALDYFVESLRVDTRLTPLKITLIKPGFVATALTHQNDFPMPWIISPQNAAVQIINAIAKQRTYFAFPWRLQASLRVLSLFSSAWLKWVAPKITRIKYW